MKTGLFAYNHIYIYIIVMSLSVICEDLVDPQKIENSTSNFCFNDVTWLVVSNIFIFTPTWGNDPI